MDELGFYRKYVELMGNLRDKPDMATPYKINYLKEIIKNNHVYKFVSLNDTEEKVRNKLDTFKNKKIWFSFYKTLNDETEFQINYKVKKIANKTGRSIENIHLLVNFLTEIYDVFSLSHDYHEYMWDDYASNGNGFCIEFFIDNLDYLYPVEYIDKRWIDFDKMITSAINEADTTLSIIPWVIKNPYNITSKLDSTREKEVRILYSPYDFGEINNGKLQYNLKEKMKYKGIAKPYSDFSLRISNVIIGENCSEEITSDLVDYLKQANINWCIHKKK